MDRIVIIAGSESDLKTVEVAKPYLDFFEIVSEIKILSAHRQHDELIAYIRQLDPAETRAIIACAGMAAHLPGVIAAVTRIPVIGVPLEASPLQGVDALYSIVQMPKGIPVASMAIGKAGMINAVIFCARILALQDTAMAAKLSEFHNRGSKL